MTKQEFDNLYRDLPRRIQKAERWLERLEKQKTNVPVIKDKVQASEKDFPYTPIRVTVDAYDPVAMADIDRRIKKHELLIQDLQKRFDELKYWIYTLDDILLVDLLEMVYVECRSYQDVQKEMFLSKPTISRIIRKAIEQNTGKWGLSE